MDVWRAAHSDDVIIARRDAVGGFAGDQGAARDDRLQRHFEADFRKVRLARVRLIDHLAALFDAVDQDAAARQSNGERQTDVAETYDRDLRCAFNHSVYSWIKPDG
jgi:hypothetical protein